jgi:Mrp family chromosome partitioning ATPase
MERVIAQLAEDSEYIIIDTPPVLPVTDASVLAPKVDGVILVARVEHTTRDECCAPGRPSNG